jgi:drug/metabolite transporter (DMT)-like permease
MPPPCERRGHALLESETTERQPDHLALPVTVALVVMVVWGGTAVFTKIATGQMDPLLVGILRTVLGACLALPLALVTRQRLPKGAHDRRLLAFSGFAAFIAFPLVFVYGQDMTTAVHGALIFATLPVLTSLFGTIVERRRVSAAWIAGCVIAVAGTAVVILWRGSGASDESSVVGDLLVLAASVVCAMGYVVGARLSQRGYLAVPTTLWGISFSAVVLLPLLGWSLASGGVPEADAAAWGSILALATLVSVLGYIGWYWALAKGGISRIASTQFTEPLFGVALAALLLGERPAPVTLIGAAGVLLGAWLVLRAGRPAASRTTRTRR